MEIGKGNGFFFGINEITQKCFDLFEKARNNEHILIVEDGVKNEFPGVLKGIVHDKCNEWGIKRYSPARQKAINKVKRKIDKFIGKYHANEWKISCDYGKDELSKVRKFYKKRKEKLENITKKKLSRIKDNKKRKEKQRQREDGYIPEKPDIRIFASAVYANKEHPNSVGIWSMDEDFTEFKSGILDEFSIEIFEDSLPA